MWKTSEYRAWVAMRSRCRSTTNAQYEDYGGRGIAVCDRWQKFENFIADMGMKPTPEHSIDRIDNNNGYSPENCRWAIRKQQQNNTRSNRIVEIGGERLPLTIWCERLGINRNTVYSRLNIMGWSPFDALTKEPAFIGARASMMKEKLAI